MILTTVIRNAVVVDGTGGPSFSADVGIAADRIAIVGEVADAGDAQVIDAAGLTLAPGFIEGHTHYDPQLSWDRLATPTIEHGVTTILTGACSFSLAPIRPELVPTVVGLFKKAEDLSQSYFDAAVPFTWESFPEWIDHIRPGLGPNVAPFVGHTPLRHYVMGKAAQERTATDAELTRMCELLREAVRAGAVGLSMSYMDTDENDVPIASRWADTRERIALAEVLVAEGRGLIMADLDMASLDNQFLQMEEFAEISLATGVHGDLLGLFDTPLDRTLYRRHLDRIEELAARGASIAFQTTTKTFDQFFELSNSFFTFFLMNHWKDVMVKPHSERRQAFTDPAQRRLFEEGMQPFYAMMRNTSVDTGHSAHTQRYHGRRIADIAADEGKTWTDALLDIALADDLATRFAIRDTVHADVEIVGEILNHPLVHIAGSDGGAHVSQICTSGDTTWALQHWVRKTGKLTLERAIHRMTGELATAYNIRDRGFIKVGGFADLVLFDANTVGKGADYRRADLPDGTSRYVADAIGIDRVWINGQAVVEAGKYTQARPGRIV